MKELFTSLVRTAILYNNESSCFDENENKYLNTNNKTD